MAETVLHTLVTNFEADTSGMQSAVANLDSTVTAATSNMSANISALESVLAGMTATATANIGAIGGLFGSLAIGGFGAVAGLVAELSGVSAGIAKIGDRAQDLRLPADLLLALGLAAAQSRVSQNEYNAALDQFTTVSKQADTTSSAFYAALRNVGAGFVTAFKDAPTQQARLQILGQALKSASGEVERLQLAQTAFGSQSQRVIGLFEQMADGASALEAKAAALGITMNDAMIQKADQAQANAGTLATVLKDKLLVILGDLLPVARDLIPVVEALGKAFSYMVQSFAPVQDRSTDLLKGQLNNIDSAISGMDSENQKLRDKISAISASVSETLHVDMLGNVESSTETSGPSLIQRLIGATPQNWQATIDSNEKMIEAAKKQRAEIAAVLASRSDKPAPNASKPPPAFKPQPSLTGGDSKDYFDRQVDSLNKHAAALDADRLAIGRNESQTETYKAELALLQAVQRDGGEVTNAQIEKYTEVRASMSAQQALTQAGITLNTQHAASFQSVTQRISASSSALMASKASYEGFQETLKTFGDDAVTVFDNMLTHAQSFSKIMLSVLQSLEKQLLEAGLVGGGPFAKLFGMQSSTPGGTGGLFGLLGMFTGMHAAGGSIGAGQWGIAGEAGPEVIMGPSTVIPRSAFGGGGTTQIINSHVYVNGARGNAEIMEMVNRGQMQSFGQAAAMLRGYDKGLPSHLNDIQRRFG